MKTKQTFALRLVIFFTVLIVLIIGGWLWWQDGMTSVDPSDNKAQIFTVKRGEGVRSITTRLSENRLIRSSTAFYILVKVMGIERSIQAGDFRLMRSMDAITLARELTHGVNDVWVTIPEGWRKEEVATKLAKELDVPEQEFLKYAKEGYMFPDTYMISREASAAGIADIFILNFNKKITQSLREDGRKTGLTFPEIITLASIIEREGRSDEDRPMIAGILLNRLRADWPLQTDATLQYALGYQSREKTWWKKALFDEDKAIESLYNTYKYKGLPLGPIANPGISAIKAVVYSKTSDYWFYLHDAKGVAHYGKTVEDHAANISKYLQ
jgi:UPF0755 protein